MTAVASDLRAKLRESFGFLCQVNELQAALLVSRKLENMGSPIQDPEAEFLRFVLASLRTTIHDFYGETPRLRQTRDEFHEFFDKTQRSSQPREAILTQRLLVSIQYILLPVRVWVESTNDEDESKQKEHQSLFEVLTEENLLSYYTEDNVPDSVREHAQAFQSKIDAILANPDQIYENACALIAEYPLIAFQTSVIRFLNGVEDDIFEDTYNPFPTSHRASRDSLISQFQGHTGEWDALNSVLSGKIIGTSDTVSLKRTRNDEDSIISEPPKKTFG
ncbi:hypothetical protein Ae201684P_015159 [Aphanomyces euteiches]|nr:hypothetical protein Ae201684P_015159 [Aphanomyces euteiches]